MASPAPQPCSPTDVFVHFRACSKEKLSSIEPVELDTRRLQTVEILTRLSAAATVLAATGGDPMPFDTMILSGLGLYATD